MSATLEELAEAYRVAYAKESRCTRELEELDKRIHDAEVSALCDRAGDAAQRLAKAAADGTDLTRAAAEYREAESAYRGSGANDLYEQRYKLFDAKCNAEVFAYCALQDLLKAAGG